MTKFYDVINMTPYKFIRHRNDVTAFSGSFFIYRAKNKTVKQKLKNKSANVATFKLNTDIYYLEYTHF